MLMMNLLNAPITPMQLQPDLQHKAQIDQLTPLDHGDYWFNDFNVISQILDSDGFFN
jgi:hypothetical protein